MPLFDATYCSLTDKIYGMMGPYVVQFNATTGAKEGVARVAAPMIGPCRICFHAPTSLLYVSCFYDPSWVDLINNTASPRSIIIPVSPMSPWATGAVIDIYSIFADLSAGFSKQGINGPIPILSNGNYLYFGFRFQAGGGQLFRVNPSNTVDNATNAGVDWSSWNVEQFAVSGASLYWPNPGSPNAGQRNADFSGISNQVFMGAMDETPVALDFDGTLAWAVCGNQWLLGINFAGLGSYTPYNIESGTTSPLKPFRIRYRSSDNSVYMPSQNKDAIILRNCGTGILSMKTGFDGPVDVVFTPTKAFAVQSGPVGLKEIV